MSSTGGPARGSWMVPMGPSLGPPRKFQEHPETALDLSRPLTPLGPPWYSPQTPLGHLEFSRTLLGSPGTFEDCSQTKRVTALAGLGLPGVTSGCPQGIWSDTLPTLWKRTILHRQAPLAESGICPKQGRGRNRGLFHAESSNNSPFHFFVERGKSPPFFPNLTAFRLDFCIRTGTHWSCRIGFRGSSSLKNL